MSFWNKRRHWALRAEQVRALAKDMADPVARNTLLGIANDYDELARLAENAYNSIQPRTYYREQG